MMKKDKKKREITRGAKLVYKVLASTRADKRVGISVSSENENEKAEWQIEKKNDCRRRLLVHHISSSSSSSSWASWP